MKRIWNNDTTFDSLPSINMMFFCVFQFLLFPPRQTVEGVIDDLKEGDKREAHAKPKQTSCVGNKSHDRDFLVPPYSGDDRLLFIFVEYDQVNVLKSCATFM